MTGFCKGERLQTGYLGWDWLIRWVPKHFEEGMEDGMINFTDNPRKNTENREQLQRLNQIFAQPTGFPTALILTRRRGKTVAKANNPCVPTARLPGPSNSQFRDSRAAGGPQIPLLWAHPLLLSTRPPKPSGARICGSEEPRADLRTRLASLARRLPFISIV